MASEFSQAVHRQAVEHPFKDRQQRKEEHSGRNTADDTVTHLGKNLLCRRQDDVRPLGHYEHRHVQKRDDEDDGD